jgi:predicted transcriptional regulator
MKLDTDMKLPEVLLAIKATPLTNSAATEITGCYISDLLSEVLAHAKPGMLWVTIQIHRNVVSVAATKDIAAVLFTRGRKPDAETIAEAEEEGIALLATPLSTYEAAGKLWEAGLRE